MSVVGVHLAGEVLALPSNKPGSWSLSWLPSSDLLGAGSQAEQTTSLFSRIWCFVADVSSPIEWWGWCEPHHMKELSLMYGGAAIVFPSKIMAVVYCCLQKCIS